MPIDQSAKAAQFQKLHEGPGAFVIANVWDIGSARQMAGMGFQALATSSGAAAGVLGRADGRMSRAEAMAHAARTKKKRGSAIIVWGQKSYDNLP